jgi:hypothetical protein
MTESQIQPKNPKSRARTRARSSGDAPTRIDGPNETPSDETSAIQTRLVNGSSSTLNVSEIPDGAVERAREPEQAKQSLEAELNHALAENRAQRALLATQREHLRDLRQLLDAVNEGLRQQKITADRHIRELDQQNHNLRIEYEKYHNRCLAIYGFFNLLRSAILEHAWEIFGPVIRDRELYEAVFLIFGSGLFDEAYFCSQCAPGEIAPGVAPIIHYLRRGDAQNLDPHVLFKGEFYRRQLGEGPQPRNALVDYLRSGRGHAPHPLFMPDYYVKQIPGWDELKGISPLTHYCAIGGNLKLNPHPVFDAPYYCNWLENRGIDTPKSPLEFFLVDKITNISPHPLFDSSYYLGRYSKMIPHGMHPLMHYLSVGDRQNCNPHLYFHIRFYRIANPGVAETDLPALVHYILSGAKEHLSPHPMFDPSYYGGGDPDLTEAGHEILVHFIDKGEIEGRDPHPIVCLDYVKQQLGARGLSDDRPFRALLDPKNVDWLSPHPLFDIAYYRGRCAAAAAYSGGAFLFYLLIGKDRDEPPHPLFSPAFYRLQAASQGIEVDNPLAHVLKAPVDNPIAPHPLFDVGYYTRSGPSITENPLLHYLTEGDQRDRDPHPLFGTAYYKRTACLSDDNALLHYVRSEGRTGNPHPLFETAYYLAQHGSEVGEGITPLEHYLSEPDTSPRNPHPLFDEAFYWEQVSEPERRTQPALMHYLAHGATAPSPHPLFDRDYFTAGRAHEEPALLGYLRQFEGPRDRVWELHRLEFREANRQFCSFSYLLDHPGLPTGQIPFLRFLGGADVSALVAAARKAPPDAAASLTPISNDAGRLAACARERIRRTGTAPNRGIAARLDADYQRLAAALAPSAIRLTQHPDRTEPSSAIGRMKRLAVYLINEENVARDHLLMIDALHAAGYVTAVVGSRPDECAHATASTLTFVREPCPRNDFACWAAILAHLAPALVDVDHILLLNDDLVGPFGDIGGLLRKLERAPAPCIGLTGSPHGCGNSHMLRGDLIQNGGLVELIVSGTEAGAAGEPPHLRRNEVAAHLDYAATRDAWLRNVAAQRRWARQLPNRLDQLGLRGHLPEAVAGRFASSFDDWLVDRRDRVSSGEPFDPQHLFWDTLFGPDFPFLNRELLLVNPHRVPTILRLGEALARHGDPAAIEALHDLVPRDGPFPKSYLRISHTLLEACGAPE